MTESRLNKESMVMSSLARSTVRSFRDRKRVSIVELALKGSRGGGGGGHSHYNTATRLINQSRIQETLPVVPDTASHEK